MTHHQPFEQLYAMLQRQALVVSMKEIYGWLLIMAILTFAGILVHHGGIEERPEKEVRIAPQM